MSWPTRILRRTAIFWRRRSRQRAAGQIADQLADQVEVWRRRVASTLGAIVLGLVALAFAWTCDGVQTLFFRASADFPYAPLVITPATFALAAWLTSRWVDVARGSGIPQVIAAARLPGERGSQTLVSLCTAIAKFGLTALGLLGGGSFGREGPTVQISAAIMTAMHRLFRVPITPGVIIAGGAAGVAAAFNTPLAGVAFAIEELAAAYEQRVALLVMGAVMIAGLTSLGIAGDYVYFGATNESLSLMSALTVAPVIGIAGGLTGGLFARLLIALLRAKHPVLRRIKAHPIAFAAGAGLLVAVIGIASGGVTFGTGYEQTRALVEGGSQEPWLAPAKFIATLASSGAGIPGGVFAPSLSVGAGLGDAFSGLFPAIPIGALVILGMVAHFTGVVRAPLTAVIILSEATGSHAMILPLFATALIADGTSKMVGRDRLYHVLSKPFLEQAAPRPPETPPPQA